MKEEPGKSFTRLAARVFQRRIFGGKLPVCTLVLSITLLSALLAVMPVLVFGADDAQGSGQARVQSGGVQLARGSIIRGEEFEVRASTEITIEEAVSPAIPEHEAMQKFYLTFSRNVAYANAGRDDAFIEQNKSLITLLEQDGAEFEGYTVGTFSSPSDRQALFIFTTKWLKPLTTYQIVIEPGIQAANGTDVSTERYVVTFTTNAECENGFNLYQNALFVAMPIVMLVGIIAAIVRIRKLRHG